MINVLHVLMFAAAISTAALIWVLIGYAERWGLVDYADTDRKRHAGEVPLIGGVAIFICLQLFQLIYPSYPISLSISLFILVVVGIIDDRSNLPAAHKLFFQCLATSIMIFGANIKIVSLGTLPNGTELILGHLSVPITLIFVVGLINAMNMIDGIDGLAASLTILALTYLFFTAGITGKPIDTSTLVAIAILVGTLLGFLVFNLEWISGKKIFLGDAGSMMLGLFLAFVLIQTSQRPPLVSVLSSSMMPWVVAIPVLDAAAVFAQRVAAGKSPMRADRSHLHHRLMDMGFSMRLTLIVILFFSLFLFAIGIILSYFGGLHAGLGFLCLSFLYVIAHIKNREQK